MIVMLAGPIAYWWGEKFMGDPFMHYNAWRDQVASTLVSEGHLIYRPHVAFKGTWNESAQAVNDTAIRVSDVMLNMSPPGVHSVGTELELIYATQFDVPVVDAPCPQTQDEFPDALAKMLFDLENLHDRA